MNGRPYPPNKVIHESGTGGIFIANAKSADIEQETVAQVFKDRIQSPEGVAAICVLAAHAYWFEPRGQEEEAPEWLIGNRAGCHRLALDITSAVGEDLVHAKERDMIIELFKKNEKHILSDIEPLSQLTITWLTKVRLAGEIIDIDSFGPIKHQ
jgi:hypothetical protein